MKKFAKLLAVALAVLTLASCSLVTVNPEKITVATVNGETITKAQFEEELNAMLTSYGYTQDSAEIADQLSELKTELLDVMINNMVINQKIKENGFDVISDEEKAEAEQYVMDWYNEQYDLLFEAFSADSEDPAADANAAIDNFFASYGTTLEEMKTQQIEAIPSNKLYDLVTKDVIVTEEEAKISYAENVADDKDLYDSDLSAYIDSVSNNYIIYYVPEGCFYVKHILIGFDELDQAELRTIRSDDDEAVAATADAKREELLAGIQEEAETVLAAVEAGGDFDALIAEYGDDPGMSAAGYEKGYLTYVGNPSYVAEFTAACDGLTEDGMTTGLVASDYGYHIIRRVATEPAGEVPFEDVKEDLMAGLLDTAKSNAYDDAVAAWVEESDIVIKDKNL